MEKSQPENKVFFFIQNEAPVLEKYLNPRVEIYPAPRNTRD